MAEFMGGVDHARAHGIDADAARRIIHRGALRQADHAMFSSVVGRPARQPDKAADRGTVDDSAATLRAHLAQLMLHTGPDTAQIYGRDPLEALPASAKAFPVASPMPELAPVTRATWPSKS
jgi:hypothetical protein